MMMRALRFALSPLLLLAACATAPPPGEVPPPPPTGWRVGTAEHISLWYHALAVTLAPGERADSVPVPRYAPGYVDSITAVERRQGVYPTPLDQRAEEFARTFRSDEAYNNLQFVPLYFRSGEAMFSAIELWNRAGGDPRRASSAQAAQLIAFFSSLFPRPENRRAVTEWAALVQREDSIFYRAYWDSQAAALAPRVTAVQQVWDALAPSLANYLEFVRLRRGELFLVPALGAEGRLVTTELEVPRSAVLAPPAAHPDYAVLAFVHELLYPLVGEVIREYVAPARVRELGAQRLAALSALRGGAMLLERAAPARVDSYRRFYLEASGRTPAPGESLEAAFAAAFPLPPELEGGLRTAVDNALAGI